MSALAELKDRAATLHTAVLDAWVQELKADDRRFQPAAVYASGRKKCVRAMALDLIAWDQKPAFEPEALERMRQGKEREKDIIARLIRIGNSARPRFEVIHEQYGENLKDRKGRIVIRMKIDGRFKFETGEHPPFEIKRYAMADGIDTVEDFDKSPWTRGAVDQMLMYLLAHNEPFGFFVLETRGLPKLIAVFLDEHLERAEAFLRDAETAMDAKEAYAARGQAALPPFINDPSECRRCPFFGRVCNPPVNAGAGIRVIDDPELEEWLKRRDELAPASSEYQRLDRAIKERFKGVELALIGDFQISGKPVERKGYEVKPATTWQISIERLAKANGVAQKR